MAPRRKGDPDDPDQFGFFESLSHEDQPASPARVSRRGPSFIQPKRTREVAEEAMQRAEHLSGPDFKVAMLEAIRQVAKRMLYFRADHVWQELGMVGDGKRDNGSGLGPMLRRACKLGIIRAADHQRSQRPSTHGRPLTMWQSLIFEGDQAAGMRKGPADVYSGWSEQEKGERVQ